jgi:hypothetical protein
MAMPGLLVRRLVKAQEKQQVTYRTGVMVSPFLITRFAAGEVTASLSKWVRTRSLMDWGIGAFDAG